MYVLLCQQRWRQGTHATCSVAHFCLSVLACLRGRPQSSVTAPCNCGQAQLRVQVPPVCAFMLFTGYEFTEARLPSALAFTVLTLFNVLRFPLIVLPKALRALSGAVQCLLSCSGCTGLCSAVHGAACS